jgi:hypothetical protein
MLLLVRVDHHIKAPRLQRPDDLVAKIGAQLRVKRNRLVGE